MLISSMEHYTNPLKDTKEKTKIYLLDPDINIKKDVKYYDKDNPQDMIDMKIDHPAAYADYVTARQAVIDRNKRRSVLGEELLGEISEYIYNP